MTYVGFPIYAEICTDGLCGHIRISGGLIRRFEEGS